jgi:hypothetical protein
MPIRVNKAQLKERGYEVKIFNQLKDSLLYCDILCLVSKSAIPLTNVKGPVFVEDGELIQFIKKAKKTAGKVIWFDSSDSTGVTHFELLPYVDLYLKKQIFKDQSLYQNFFYGGRIFTDFYHQHFGITDDSIFDQFYPLKEEYANKVDLSWNIGLGDVYNSFATHSKIRRYLPDLWNVNHKVSFVSPSRERTQDVFISTSANLGRPTVSFHRQEIIRQLELIANNNHNLTMKINEKRTSFKQYRAHISNTKIAPSPFGWGELGVRDYEAIILGALLIKPDMTHMKTWPNIFIENETYIPFKWNFSDLKDIITEYIDDDKKRIKITEQSQEAYHTSISEQGNEQFCDWFIQQINL